MSKIEKAIKFMEANYFMVNSCETKEEEGLTDYIVNVLKMVKAQSATNKKADNLTETKKMPFHLTITNNKTGETVRDLDFDALIGSAHISDVEAAGLFITSCNTLTVAATLAATENTLHRVEQKDPRLLLLKLGFGLRTEEVEEGTEETPEGQA